jgi:hypothetical protein
VVDNPLTIQTKPADSGGVSGLSKGLRDAIVYAGKGWIPINNDAVDKIKRRLASKEYEGNRELLIEDLKGDISLFALTVRCLDDFIVPDQRDQHPISLLRALDLETIRKLVFHCDGVTTHRLEQATELQQLCTRHALISCGASQVIASHVDHDPHEVATAAMLRQLGLMLVAWNYPRTYQKAISSITASGGSLDEVLFSYLGFAPSKLGQQLAIDWSQDPGLFVAIGAAVPAHLSVSDLSEEEYTKAKEVAEICEIGEALARVNDPSHFPAASKEWEAVLAELTDYLGSDGLEKIKESLTKTYSSYLTVNPKLLDFDTDLKKKARATNNVVAQKMIAANQNVKKCPAHLQELFKEVYSEVREAAISIDALNVLVKQLIPRSGFIRGCVYLSDAEKGTLVPKLKIGDVDINRFKVLRSGSSRYSHPVLEALTCQIPIKQENVIMYGEMVSHVTGVFGTRDKVGVLYLEMGHDLLTMTGNEPLIIFKAIRHALNDCLNLREIAK